MPPSSSDVAPLVVAGPFGPFIIRGTHNRSVSRTAVLGVHAPRLYHLVALASGCCGIAGPGAPQGPVAAPAAFLLHPGNALRLTMDAKSRWGELVFQLVHAARRPGASGGAWVNLGAAQPTTAAVFGCVLPPSVPEAFTLQALATVATATALCFKAPLHQAEANLLLGRFLVGWARWEQARASAVRPPTFDPWARLEDLARDRLDTGITVSDLAAAAGLTPSHFCAAYRAARGESPGAFLNRLRLEVATIRLRDGGDVRGCAHFCGFRSPTSFAAFFKRQTGQTPSRWRRRQHDGCKHPGQEGRRSG
jgi:AraC-like DNA-binding protein